MSITTLTKVVALIIIVSLLLLMNYTVRKSDQHPTLENERVVNEITDNHSDLSRDELNRMLTDDYCSSMPDRMEVPPCKPERLDNIDYSEQYQVY